MEEKKGKTPSPFSAEYDAGSCKKTDDTPQVEEEHRNESLFKNRGGQTSTSEKRIQDKVLRNFSSYVFSSALKPRTHSVVHLPPSKYSGEMNDDPFSSHDSCQKLRTTEPQSMAIIPSATGTLCPENSAVFFQDSNTGEKQKEQTNKLTQPEPPSDSTAFSNPWEQSPDILDLLVGCSGPHDYLSLNSLSPKSKTESELGEKSQQVLPTPHSKRRRSGRGLHTLMSESTTISPESSAEHLPGPSTREKQKDQAIPNKRTQPEASMGLSETSLQFVGGSSDSFREGTEVCYLPPYSTFSPSQINSAEIITQPHNSSDMPLNYSVMYVDTDSTDSDCDIYEHSEMKSALEHKRNPRSRSYRKRKACHTLASNSDAPACLFDQPQPDTLTETGMTHNPSFQMADGTPGVTKDDDDNSDCAALYGSTDDELFLSDWDYNYSLWGGRLNRTNRMDTDDDDPSIYTSVCTAGSGENMFELLCARSESASGGDSDVQMEMEGSVTAVNYWLTNTLPTHSHLHVSSDPGSSKRGSSSLTRSHSVPSLGQITSAKNKTFRRAMSLPVMLLKSSFRDFTPDITVDENDETYWFQCSRSGLYQCSVTGLVFRMEGEGEVVYRIVPWNRRLLAQHHKQPAGPLFDIKCLQQSVCQLHLPHCEIRSTGGCQFLSVAHVNEEGIEFITPHKITETHVIINITGFSGFGNVKDEDSPPDPVRALVLLFYRPLSDPDLTSLLNVLLLPKNVVLRDVLRTRKKLVGDESYIETSPHCKLHPKQEYSLSTCPGDDSVLVQPTEAEFDCDNYDNYFPSFQVNWETALKHIKLFLRDTNKHSVWERRVCLSSTGVKRSCTLNLPPNERLLDIRSSFIDGISGPVLKSLLDKLFDRKVMTDSERESADEIQNKRDKARFVIDTVRRKGEAASSEMIEFLCEVDPFLCEHLGLI